MLLLIYSHFFRQQVCLNLFLSRTSCLRCEIFSPVSHSWWNHVFCDLHLIFLPLAFNPASLHASTQFRSSIDAIMFVAYIRESPPKLGFWCNSSTTRNHIPEFTCQHHAEITQSHPFAPLIRLSTTTHNLLTINASEISSNNSEKLSLLADKHHWTFLLYSSYSSPGWTVTRRLRGLKLRSIVR